MSYIVIHDDNNGVSQFRQVESIDSAAEYVERLRNREGVMTARIFELAPVAFEMKPYFKVELGDAAPAATSDPGPVQRIEVVEEPEVLPTASDADVVFETLTEPIETIASVSAAEPVTDSEPSLSGAGETRRGLFGR